MDIRELALYVYNASYQMIGVVEKYVSLIWSDRYDEAGDFELEVVYDPEIKDLLQKDRFVTTDYSDRTAIIEKIEISKDEDGNAKMVVSGRSVEVILDRRIVLKKTEFPKDDNILLQNGVKKLLNENLISPTDAKRKISNFVFSESSAAPITSLKIEETYDKDSLYEIVTGLCSDKHIGFKVLKDLSGKYTFSFYKGKDISKNVLFSPYYDNLNNSQYYSSIEDYKNVMFVSKDDENYLTVFTGSSVEPEGFSRRETHESASGLKENKEGDLTDAELKTKAEKKLKSEHKIKTGFEGDIIPDVLYAYRTDYNVGDKVQLEDEYGNREAVYISEVVITFDENGLSIIPTFKEIDWDEEEYKWL